MVRCNRLHRTNVYIATNPLRLLSPSTWMGYSAAVLALLTLRGFHHILQGLPTMRVKPIRLDPSALPETLSDGPIHQRGIQK